jgi:hypothetical protein
MMHLEFNQERNRLVENWLIGNVSDNSMRETLVLYHYDGVDYPKKNRSKAF